MKLNYINYVIVVVSSNFLYILRFTILELVSIINTSLHVPLAGCYLLWNLKRKEPIYRLIFTVTVQ